MSLSVKGEHFHVRVLEDTAEIIDFGPRYEDDDPNDGVVGCSDDEQSVAGSDGGSAVGSFVLESPTPVTRKLKRFESDKAAHLTHENALHEEAVANLGNLHECEEPPICMVMHDECSADQDQLVGNPSGLGPSHVPIHSGVNIDLPIMISSPTDGGPAHSLVQNKFDQTILVSKVLLESGVAFPNPVADDMDSVKVTEGFCQN